MMRVSKLMWTLPFLLLALALAGPASAYVISIDGDDSEWPRQGLTYDNDDPNEPDIPNPWDIDKNWDVWGNSDPDGTPAYFFMMQQYAAWQAPPEQGVDRAFILLNTDRDLGTGRPNHYGYQGVDYFITSTPSNLAPGVAGMASLFQWVWGGTNWTTSLITDSIPVARDNNPVSQTPMYWAIEFQLNKTHIFPSSPEEEIWWGAMLDDDSRTGPTRDTCRDAPDWKPADIPEPGTMLMFGLGLLGVAAIRRRRS